MRSPMMALAWKEWREQRPVVIVAILLAIATPFFLMAVTAGSRRGLDFQGVAQILPAVLLLMACPLFAAAAGSSTIANEIGDGTLGFLLSRPLSRPRIWTVKVAVGAAASALIFLASALVASAFAAIAGTGESAASLLGIPQDFAPLLAMLAGIGASVMLFSTSVFFSTVFSRAMNAAVAGLAASLAIFGGIALIWSRVDLIPRLEPGLFALEIVLAAAVSLLASLYLFCRGELFGGRGAWMRGLLAGLAALGTLTIVTVPVIWSQVRLSPGSAELLTLEASPGGDTIYVTATSQRGFSPEVWQIHADGTGIERLTGRLTFSPAVSPDGTMIAYLTMRGPLGLRSDRPEIRVAQVDGREDRAITSSFAWSWRPGGAGEISFSPDGSRIVVTDGRVLIAAAIDGSRTTQVPIANTPLRWGRLVGWSAGGEEALLLASGRRNEGSTLGAVDAATGRIRVIREDASRVFTSFTQRASRERRRLPLLTDSDPGAPSGFELALIDLADGSSRKVSGRVRGLAADLSTDERTLAYATISGAPGGDGSDLHILDLESGADRVIATIEGRAWSVTLSPSKDRVLVHRFEEERKAMPPAVVDLDGRVRALTAGWAPIGWQGRDRVLLMQGEPPASLAVAEVETGALRIFYP